MSETQLLNLAITQIVEPDDAMRHQVDPDSIVDLAQSISQVGLIEPIVVKKKGDNYEVIAGHRRLMACRSIGLAFVPSRVVVADDEMTEALKMHENLYRKDVNVVEEATFISRAMDRLKIDVDRMASVLGRSTDYVRERLLIQSYPEYLLSPLSEGKISFSVARTLFRIEDEALRREYINYAVDGGCTEAMARDWLRKYRRDLASPAGQVETIAEQAAPIPPAPKLTVQCIGCLNDVEIRLTQLRYVCNHCSTSLSQRSASPSE